MTTIQVAGCNECEYRRDLTQDNDSIWCKMHYEYFDCGDHCFDFTPKNNSAKSGVRGNLVRLLTLTHLDC